MSTAWIDMVWIAALWFCVSIPATLFVCAVIAVGSRRAIAGRLTQSASSEPPGGSERHSAARDLLRSSPCSSALCSLLAFFSPPPPPR